MKMFVSRVCEMVVKESRTAMIIKEVEFSCWMVHGQKIEEEKPVERCRATKWAKVDDVDFSHSRSDGHVHSMF